MPELLMHDQTKQQVVEFLANPAHAVLLVGLPGIGKGALALHVAAQMLQVTDEQLAQQPYFKHIVPEKTSISIDTIRELQHFMQLKTIGQAPIRRVIVMEHADGLTIEAQNAYLKLLEEPPADTVMILTVANQRALLPTIQSRIQTLAVHAPSADAVRSAFATRGKDPQAVTQAYFLSGGLPGLMTALLDDDQEHQLAASVATAKKLLQQSTFDRLCLVDGLSKQKDEAYFLFDALERMAQVALQHAAQKAEPSRIKQWHRVLTVTARAREALGQSVNAKLVLTNAMLEL